jgi:hypothetical protein
MFDQLLDQERAILHQAKHLDVSPGVKSGKT